MKKKWALLFFMGLFGIAYILVFKPFRKVSVEQTEHVKLTEGTYFLPIAIEKFTAANLPCVSVKVGDEIASAMLDLGFRGQFGFTSDFLGMIENKKYLRSKKMYGVRGTEYEERLYEVPTIAVGAMSFSHPVLHERSEEFDKDSTLIQKQAKCSLREAGKIGWEAFGNTNLFLDLENEKIAFCDSLDTLKKQGYATCHFTKAPLLLERGLVEFMATTPIGPLRCMLDTGATWNVLNSSVTKDESVDQAALDLRSVTEYPSFQIGEDDFGKLTFHCIPIKLPIHIEAILGMEFFENHRVFLDFSENCAYFSKDKI